MLSTILETNEPRVKTPQEYTNFDQEESPNFSLMPSVTSPQEQEGYFPFNKLYIPQFVDETDRPRKPILISKNSSGFFVLIRRLDYAEAAAVQPDCVGEGHD